MGQWPGQFAEKRRYRQQFGKKNILCHYIITCFNKWRNYLNLIVLILKIIKLKHDRMLSEKWISDNLQKLTWKNFSDSLDSTNWVGLKNSENGPFSIHVKDKTNNGSKENTERVKIYHATTSSTLLDCRT